LLFHMQPEELRIDLTKHENVLQSESFTLHAVTVQSAALLAETGAKSVDNGQVFVNDVLATASPISKTDGAFRLAKLTTGTYKVGLNTPRDYTENNTLHQEKQTAHPIKIRDAKVTHTHFHTKLLDKTIYFY